ncbi:MAG: hypothetical protein JOZ81_30920, partial [Chloroflexi bacterium]|nr:hypothetical protein [Chloroflexota bacterium]
IQAFRVGGPAVGWYPPGLAALFAASLQLVPWVDTAQGAFELGMGLPLLAALAVYGLGIAIWRDPRMAATGSICLGTTYVFPNFLQLWSAWPLSSSVIFVLGVWMLALQYLDSPSHRWAILAGTLLAAIVLVHGTELYTLAIVLPVVLVSAWHKAQWRQLPVGVGIAVLVGVACAAPYVPTLLGWANSGGAYAVGIEDSQMPSPAGDSTRAATFVAFALDTLGVDLPTRVLLVVVGVIWSLRSRVGRSTMAIAVIFGGLRRCSESAWACRR